MSYKKIIITIINALSYALFGNALYSIKKDNLVNKTKRTCVNALNQRLYDSQKKDKIKNRAIIFTIFFSVGIIGFIAG